MTTHFKFQASALVFEGKILLAEGRSASKAAGMNYAERERVANVAFVSSNDAWGGSEELWSRAAIHLASAGAAVRVYKGGLSKTRAIADRLRAAGCETIADLNGPPWTPQVVRHLISKIPRSWARSYFTREFRYRNPALVVISQGLNYDGWYVGDACRGLKIPYVLISQKASDLYWPGDAILEELRAVYRDASAALFVSDHNRVLTEEQLSFRLPRARVVRNPFNGSWQSELGWPPDGPGFRLACVARLDTREKGQDLLLRVLARQKWRERPLSVVLFGSGHNERGLRSMAQLFQLSSVTFAGYKEEISTIWRDFHGLVLPSRCEGLPLSIVEAMLHGRVVIATDVGGNAESVIEGVTGFLANAATEEELDLALERAWTRRGDWRSIGSAAAKHARQIVEPDPVATFVRILGEIMGGFNPASSQAT